MVFTLVGVFIGGGIVGVPYATLQSGFFLALVIHIINVICWLYSVHLYLEASRISNLWSFSELGFYSFGRISIFLINGLITLSQCGMPILYFMVIGDIGHGILRRIDSLNDTFWSSKIFPKVLAAVFLFYFALKREIQELKGAGFVVLVGVIIFVSSMCILLFKEGIGHIEVEEFWEPKFNVHLIATIPIVLFAYVFHPGLYPIYNSLENKTPANGIKTILYSLGFVCVIYIIMSIVAVLKYGHELEGDVLANIGMTAGTLPVIIDVVFLIIMIMHVPLIFFIGKEAILIIYDELTRSSYSQGHLKLRPSIDDAFQGRDSFRLSQNKKSQSYQNKEDFEKHKALENEGKVYLEMNPIAYYGISIFIYITVVILSCVIQDIKIVFGIIGSFSGSWFIFIGPAAFYLRAVNIEWAKVSLWSKVMATIYILIGIVIWAAWFAATFLTASSGGLH
jgi:amino acid permease